MLHGWYIKIETNETKESEMDKNPKDLKEDGVAEEFDGR